MQGGIPEQLGAHPWVGFGASLPVRSTPWETGILSAGKTERAWTQYMGLVGSEHTWGGETTASSLLRAPA